VANDRLSRSVSFIATSMESRGFDLANAHAGGELTLHVLAAAAEHERHVIGERTRHAPAAAKTRGIKLGNLKQAEINRAKAAEQAQALRPHIERCIEAGLNARARHRHRMAANGFQCRFVASAIVSAYVEAGGSFTGRDQVRPRLGLPRAQRFGRKLKLRRARP
jgi:DNA invertase Pin-like site-specific DNA recombinase